MTPTGRGGALKLFPQQWVSVFGRGYGAREGRGRIRPLVPTTWRPSVKDERQKGIRNSRVQIRVVKRVEEHWRRVHNNG